MPTFALLARPLTGVRSLSAALALAGALLGGTFFALDSGNAHAAEVTCDFSADSGPTFTNFAGDAGCVTVTIVSSTQLAVTKVTLNPGWTYQVKSSGSNARVELRFTNASTGGRVDFRVEFGKTIVK